jgi:hypothetical protein
MPPSCPPPLTTSSPTQHPFLATASASVAEKLAQRVATSAEGRRECAVADEEDEGGGSVVHRRPAAMELPRSGSEAGEADGDDGAYSTVIFRNAPPNSNISISAQEFANSSDGEAAYSTVIVRQPAAETSAATDVNRPAPIEIPISPHSSEAPAAFSSSSSTSPASSPASVLVSFAPESTEPFASPFSSGSPHTSTYIDPIASSSPLSPQASQSPPAHSDDAAQNYDQTAAVSDAVAFAHNRRKVGTGKSRSASDPRGGMYGDAFNTTNRKRASTSGAQQQGAPLGR